MTKLANITDHIITFWCDCGHHGVVRVTDDLIEKYQTLDRVRAAARCSSCGARPKQLRISYVMPSGRPPG